MRVETIGEATLDRCYIGDVRDGLREFIEQGVRAQVCVTSPPYWSLRDYGVAGQLGLEPTIAEYVANMVDVFRLVRDVLADDGTLWLNLGDSFYSATATQGRNESRSAITTLSGHGDDGRSPALDTQTSSTFRRSADGLKPKDLCGIPWTVAFALRDDGWYLRSDIIWAKPNPMPESVTDRPTKAHEYLFLLSKRASYYYDAAAIREYAEYGRRSNFRGGGHYFNQGAAPDNSGKTGKSTTTSGSDPDAGRNRRTVWTIASEPYADAHFATFPTALVEPCILAGSRVGDVVLDPFLGSGTVAKVAQSLGRRWIGCELNPNYVAMQSKRAAQLGMAFA